MPILRLTPNADRPNYDRKEIERRIDEYFNENAVDVNWNNVTRSYPGYRTLKSVIREIESNYDDMIGGLAVSVLSLPEYAAFNWEADVTVKPLHEIDPSHKFASDMESNGSSMYIVNVHVYDVSNYGEEGAFKMTWNFRHFAPDELRVYTNPLRNDRNSSLALLRRNVDKSSATVYDGFRYNNEMDGLVATQEQIVHNLIEIRDHCNEWLGIFLIANA